MIESILSTILIPHLEQYVENFDRKRLNVGLLKGTVSLSDISLKAHALDNIHPDFPLSIAHSYLKSMNIVVPWHSLRSSPVTVEIDQIYVVLVPKRDVPYDEVGEAGRVRERKRKVLNEHLSSFMNNHNHHNHHNGSSSSNNNTKNNNSGSGGGGGFMDKMIETIINNIQVTIKNIHIRYEDAYTCTTTTTTTTSSSSPMNSDHNNSNNSNNNDHHHHHHPIVMGLSLDSMTIQSTDSDWNRTFNRVVGDLTYKLFEMNQFSFYMNTSSISSPSPTNTTTTSTHTTTSNTNMSSSYTSRGVNPQTDFISRIPNRIHAAVRMKQWLSNHQHSTTTTHLNHNTANNTNNTNNNTNNNQQQQESQFSHDCAHLLRPMNGTLRLTMQKLARVMDFSQPQFDAQFHFPSFSFHLNDQQYKHWFSLVQHWTNYPIQMARFRAFRPVCPLSFLTIANTTTHTTNTTNMTSSQKQHQNQPMDEQVIREKNHQTAKAWWQYAIRSVIHDLRHNESSLFLNHSHNHHNSNNSNSNSNNTSNNDNTNNKHPLRVQQERVKLRDRALYIELFKRFCRVPWLRALSQDESQWMEELEMKYDTRDIVYYRRLAQAEMEREYEQHEQWRVEQREREQREQREQQQEQLLLKQQQEKQHENEQQTSDGDGDGGKAMSMGRKSRSLSSFKLMRSNSSSRLLPPTPTATPTPTVPPVVNKATLSSLPSSSSSSSSLLSSLKNKSDSGGGGGGGISSGTTKAMNQFSSWFGIGKPKSTNDSNNNNGNSGSDTNSNSSNSSSSSNISSSSSLIARLLPAPGTIKLTDAERQLLYESVGYDEELSHTISESIKSNTDYVKMKIHVQVSQFEFVLWEQQAQQQQHKSSVKTSSSTLSTVRVIPIVRSLMNDLSVDIELLEGRFKCLMKMAGLLIRDEFNTQSLFRDVLKRRTTDHTNGSSSGGGGGDAVSSSSSSQKHLASFFLEKTPTSNRSNYRLDMSLDRIDIVLNTKLMQRVVNFFMFDHVNLNHLESVAKAQLEKAKTFAKKELKNILDNKKAIDLNLRIQAPTLLMPVDCTSANTRFLFMDFGQFHWSSNIVQEQQQQQQVMMVEEQDTYDRFHFLMQDIQILVPDQRVQSFLNHYKQYQSEMQKMQLAQRLQMWDKITERRNALLAQKQQQQQGEEVLQCDTLSFINGSSDAHLIERVTLDLQVAKQSSSIDSSVNEDHHHHLPRITVKGAVPSITLNISADKIAVCTDLVTQWVSFVQNPSGSTASNIKISGHLRVYGPMTDDEWSMCWIEVTNSNKLVLYDASSPSTATERNREQNRLAIVNLNNYTEIGASTTRPNTFRLVLPQSHDKPVVTLYFECKDDTELHRWVTSLKYFISTFEDNFLMGKIAKSLIKDARNEIRQGMNQMANRSNNQMLLAVDFTLNNVMVHIQRDVKHQTDGEQRQHERQYARNQTICSILFNELSSDFKHCSYDTVLLMKLKSLTIEDLMAHQKKSDSHAQQQTENKQSSLLNNHLLQSEVDDNSALVDISIIYARKGSKWYKSDNDAIVVLNSVFQRVTMHVQPMILTEFIQFGYDLQDIFDRALYDRVRVYSAKAPFSELKSTVTIQEISKQLRKTLGPDDDSVQSPTSTTNTEEDLYSDDSTMQQEQEEQRHHHAALNLNKSLFRLNMNTSDIRLMVSSNECLFTSLSMSRSSVSFELNRNDLLLSGNLGNLTVIDHITPDTIYREILGVTSSEQESLVDFQFKHFFASHRDQSDNKLSYRSSITAKMQAVRYVHIQFYTQQWYSYIKGPVNQALSREFSRKQQLTKHQQQKKTHSESSSSTKITTQDMNNEQQMMAKRAMMNKRVQVNVQMISPIIILPSSHKSYDHFIGNLGNLNIESCLDTSNDNLIDGLTFSLKNMHMSSIHGQDQLSQHVVDDVDITVRVQTVLINPDRSIPNNSLHIEISKVKYQMSEDQYQLIFNVVNDNIKAGFDQARKITSTVNSLAGSNHVSNNGQSLLYPSTTKQIIHNIEDKILTGIINRQQTTSKSEEEAKFGKYEETDEIVSNHSAVVRTKLIVNVKVPQMIVGMLRGNGRTANGEYDPLAELSISELNVCTLIRSDDSLQTDVVLGYILGVDTRTNTDNQFKTIFDSRSVNDQHKECFHLSATHIPQELKTRVSLTLSDPQIVCVPDIVLEFKNFFTNANYTATTHPFSCSTPSSPKNESSNDGCVIPLTESEMDVNSEQLSTPHSNDPNSEDDDVGLLITERLSSSSANHSFEIVTKFGKPEILLPYDASDLNSKLIVFESAFEGSFMRTPTEEKAQFDISGATVYVKQNNSNAEPIAIVEPIHVTFKLASMLTKERADRSIIIDLNQGGKVRVSYQDIRMALSIVERFKQYAEEYQSKLKNGTHAESDQADDFELLSLTPPTDATVHNQQSTNDVTTNRLEKVLQLASQKSVLAVHFKSTNDLAFLLMDDILGYDLPLTDLHFSGIDLLAKVTQDGARFAVDSSLHFICFANYYNFKYAEWEPIIESIPMAIEFSRQPRITSHQSDDSRDINSLHVKCQNVINVNITQQMIENTISTTREWINGFKEPHKPISMKFKPFSVQNQSGLQVQFSKYGDMSKSVSLLHDQELKFGFSNFRTKDFKNIDHFVYINIEGVTKKILVNKDTKYFFPIQHEEKEVMLCIDIVLLNGRKVITIHSGVKIMNNTTRSWELGMYNDGDQNLTVTSFGAVPPGCHLYVPCRLLCPSSCLTIRPDESFKWFSKKKEYAMKNVMSSNLNLLPYCRGQSGPEKMYCILRTQNKREKESWIDCVVSILAPIAVENILGLSANFTILTRSSTDPNKMNTLWSQMLMRGEKKYMYNINIKKKLWLQCTLDQSRVQWQTSDLSLIFSPQADVPLARQFLNTDHNGSKLILKLDYCHTANSYHEVCVYSSYWILNHTGLKLTLREGESEVAGQCHKKQVLPTQSTNPSVAPTHDTEPLLFDYLSGSFIFTNKVNIRLEDSFASYPFSIDNVGESSEIEVTNGTHKYPIGMSITLGPDKFKRTKMVTLSPKFILVNRTEWTMKAKQFGSTSELALEPNTHHNFYWTERKEVATTLALQFDHTEWSVPFKIDNDETILILKHTRKLLDQPKKKKTYVSVRTHQEKGITFVIFARTNHPPYYIYNRTSHDIIMGQCGVAGLFKMKPNSKAPFSWPDQTKPHTLFYQINNVEATIDADAVANSRTIILRDSPKAVTVQVSAQGFTRVLQFFEHSSIQKAQKAISKSQKQQQSLQSHHQPSSQKSQPPSSASSYHQASSFLKLETIIDLRGVGISLSDSYPEELLYVLLDHLIVNVQMTDQNQYLELKLHKLQVDNQTNNAAYPVLLSNSKKLDIGKHFIHVSMIRNYTEETYDCIPYLSVCMQEADLAFDFKLMNRMHNFTTGIINAMNSAPLISTSPSSSRSQQQQQLQLSMHRNDIQVYNIDMNVDTASTFLEQHLKLSDHKKVYFELMQLHPIRLNFSFLFNQADEELGEGSGDETNQTSKKENATLLVLQTIGAHLHANIDQAPIYLNSLILQHPFLSREALTETIQKHYTKNALSEVYKLLGSFSSIGNPIGLFNGLFKLHSKLPSFW